MAERGTDAGSDREHRGHARYHGQVDVAPFFWPGLDRLANGCGHGEDAGIAARDDGDLHPLGRFLQRGLGP